MNFEEAEIMGGIAVGRDEYNSSIYDPMAIKKELGSKFKEPQPKKNVTKFPLMRPQRNYEIPLPYHEIETFQPNNFNSMDILIIFVLIIAAFIISRFIEKRGGYHPPYKFESYNW